jgi:hypothetical protein
MIMNDDVKSRRSLAPPLSRRWFDNTPVDIPDGFFSPTSVLRGCLVLPRPVRALASLSGLRRLHRSGILLGLIPRVGLCLCADISSKRCYPKQAGTVEGLRQLQTVYFPKNPFSPVHSFTVAQNFTAPGLYIHIYMA